MPNVILAIELLTSLTKAAIQIQGALAQANKENRDITDAELRALRDRTDALRQQWDDN